MPQSRFESALCCYSALAEHVQLSPGTSAVGPRLLASWHGFSNPLALLLKSRRLCGLRATGVFMVRRSPWPRVIMVDAMVVGLNTVIGGVELW